MREKCKLRLRTARAVPQRCTDRTKENLGFVPRFQMRKRVQQRFEEGQSSEVLAISVDEMLGQVASKPCALCGHGASPEDFEQRVEQAVLKRRVCILNIES